MTGISQTLKTRLYYYSGSIILVGALILILQYNNYFYSGKYYQYQNTAAKLIHYSGKADVLQQQFLKSEVLNNDFYTTGKSQSVDSITYLLSGFISLLDSIDSDPYFSTNEQLKIKISALESDCKKLKTTIDNLRATLLDRGLFTTGKSGEWTRYGLFLEELAGTYGNISLIKEVANINKQLTEYQYKKNPEQFRYLTNLVFALKTQITTKNDKYINGISSDSQIKFIKELDSFAALTAEIQKNDLNIGFAGNEGLVGEVQISVQVIENKTENLNKLINQAILNKIEIGFFIKVLVILVFGFAYFWFSRAFLADISYTITEIRKFASELVEGKLPAPLKMNQYLEISDISNLFNKFIESLRDKIKFASTLGSGKKESSLIPLSSDDVLSNALLDMEKSLLKADEEDRKYKIEEQKRTWANEGLARFSEILRMQTDNLSALSDAIIVELVKNLRANQGSIFLFNDDNEFDIHLELISAFAYDRKKYITKRIEIGEGLVGTCAQEKLPIYLTEIPENYIEITSGLGDASPRCLLIVPLKTEEKVFGILEIASFQLLDKHEIEFVEKLTQSIASTFATVKINIHTTRLLEQSKRQAEEMAQQEEEMRQNFEELQATQEESARREAEISSLIQAVDISSLVVHTDMEGRIIELNKKFSSAVGQHRDELLGKLLKQIFVFNAASDEFYNLIREIKAGNQVSRSEHILKENGESLFFDVHYSPILDHDNRPYKILCIAVNQSQTKHLENIVGQKETEFKNLNFAYNQFQELIAESFIRCVLANDTTIIEANSNYTEITGYSTEELIGSSYRKFLKADELKQFELIWIELQKEKSYKGVIKRTTPTGEEHWLMASFIPYRNDDSSVANIYFLAQDITEKKLKYQVLEEANKEIERLKGLQNQ